jgi:CRP-like cAMP-binding protein
MVPTAVVPTGRIAATNRLLARLPAKDHKALVGRCDHVELVFGQILDEPGKRIDHVYFPIDSYVSLITKASGEASLEVGLVGDEGMHGITLALGIDVSPLQALVQGAGPALRLSATAFRRELAARPALRRATGRYLYVLMNQLAQSAACTRFHLIEARLARWLLMTQDRAHADTFSVTHEFLAWMLGVRRVGVTGAASALQRQRLITYRRGLITVLNRRGLEAASCTCYKLNKDVYDRTLS